MASSVSKWVALNLNPTAVNYVRWDGKPGGVTFSLYVPTWRVPDPTPRQIRVLVVPRRNNGDDSPNLTRSDIDSAPELAWEPIVVTLKKTIFRDINKWQYLPTHDGELAASPELHIPFGLTSNEAELLRMVVLWD
jgi:hypothetical protein